MCSHSKLWKILDVQSLQDLTIFFFQNFFHGTSKINYHATSLFILGHFCYGWLESGNHPAGVDCLIRLMTHFFPRILRLCFFSYWSLHTETFVFFALLNLLLIPFFCSHICQEFIDEALSPIIAAQRFDGALPAFDSGSNRLRWRRLNGVIIPDGAGPTEFIDSDRSNETASSDDDWFRCLILFYFVGIDAALIRLCLSFIIIH